MYTFFETNKAGKSSRGHTFCQLFITDKVSVYVVRMRLKVEVLQEVKLFSKDIGAPEAIICDEVGEQTSNNIQKVCRDIGTTFRVLEEVTTCTNSYQLYIGLIKLAVKQYMK